MKLLSGNIACVLKDTLNLGYYHIGLNVFSLQVLAVGVTSAMFSSFPSPLYATFSGVGSTRGSPVIKDSC